MTHRIPHKTKAIFVDSGSGIIAEQAAIFKERNPEVVVCVCCDGDFKDSVEFSRKYPNVQVRLFINECSMHLREIKIHWRSTCEAR